MTPRHLDDTGVARLKLRPSFERDAQQRVVVKDAPPTDHAPPNHPPDAHRSNCRNPLKERLRQEVRGWARGGRESVKATAFIVT
jgi:hypothetical protein